MPVLIFFVFVVIVIVGAILGQQAAKRRREAMGAWAVQHNLTFHPDKDHGFENRFAGFQCLRRGENRNRYAFNRIVGDWEGRELIAFDYHYQTTSTNSKGHRTTHHHYFSAVILKPRVPLQPLVIRPENFFDRMKGFFGYDDIDFESAEFSKRFYVAAPNRKWAYDVLHARAIEFLLASPAYHIEFDTFNVIAVHGRRLDPPGLTQAVRVIDGLLDLLPEYVIEQQKQLQETL